MPIPEFRPDGYLPEGLHVATEREVETRFGWGRPRRETLMVRVSKWLALARNVGATRFLLDGSFVTQKEEPGDVDAVCFLPDDFEEQWLSESPDAVQLHEMLMTRYPQELFGVFTAEA